MIFDEKTVRLKDGREAVFRSPSEDDAPQMLEFIAKASGETDFLMKFPEEYDSFTLEQEREFINSAADSPDSMMIACFIDGIFAGNCRINFMSGKRVCHRASCGIAIIRQFWGLGIGTHMFEEMFAATAGRGIRQIELDYIEGNSRARALYEKMGFRIIGAKPDAIRMRDGTFVNEYMMIKML